MHNDHIMWHFEAYLLPCKTENDITNSLAIAILTKFENRDRFSSKSVFNLDDEINDILKIAQP